METIACQRWRRKRTSYRPAGEVIRTGDYEVAAIPQDAVARAFVQRHHYSASYPAARWRFGLYRAQALVGVAVFSHPCNDAVLTSVFPGAATDAVELGRLVLLDDVPGNGETWFLARCFDLLRDEVRGVVSFSDPVVRCSADGRRVFPGHVGTIYQAHNAAYLGRGKRRTLRLLPDGTVMSDRAISKIRSGDQGWRYSASILEAHGAEPLAGDRRAWLARWLPALTRPLRHPGNHKYTWGLNRHDRKRLGRGHDYPKQIDA